MSLSKNTKRILWRVPTLSAPCERLPLNNLRNPRSRFAPPGTSGTIMVSSDTLPRRAPIRPALSTGGGRSEVSDLSSASAFSSAFFPSSGASAKSSLNCWIFCSTVWSCSGPFGGEGLRVVVAICISIVALVRRSTSASGWLPRPLKPRESHRIIANETLEPVCADQVQLNLTD